MPRSERWAPVMFSLLVAAAFALIWLGRGNILHYDDRARVETRRTGLTAILSSYNKHLLVAPIALYQLLFDSTQSSPAASAAKIATEPGYAQAAADSVLVRAGSVVTEPARPGLPPAHTPPIVAATTKREVHPARSCGSVTPAGGTVILDFVLPSHGVQVPSVSGVAANVTARRFSATFEGNQVAILTPGPSIDVRAVPDRVVGLPWSLELQSGATVRACTLG